VRLWGETRQEQPSFRGEYLDNGLITHQMLTPEARLCLFRGREMADEKRGQEKKPADSAAGMSAVELANEQIDVLRDRQWQGVGSSAELALAIRTLLEFRQSCA